MEIRQKIEQITLYLSGSIHGYEVISADWGWHIHKGDAYCGLLQYQVKKGCQGEALHHLPQEVLLQLKKLTQ